MSLLTVGFLAVGTTPAQAAPAPVLQPPANAVTADALPTVQVDGVVWSQVVVGNTVYAGGKFSNARPAGAAAGTNLTARNNLLAYDLTTGNLITSFAPNLNAQVLSVTASPDGSRIYVVGDFTTANGAARRRVAAYSTSTGQLITTFNPTGVSSQARAVIATNDTVYVGGGFNTVGTGQTRNNLVAFQASTGALLPWNPSADYTVWALALSKDGADVIAGGSFANVGGQPAYGLAKVSSTSGALNTEWKAADTVRNAGKDAGVTSLQVQGDFVYGTTYHFGPGGNLEGTFKAPVSTGVVEWVTDCHGDNYSSFLSNGIVYTAGHAHYCGNVGGGFPQYTTANGDSAWKFQRGQAWVDSGSTGEILNDAHGYNNWHGTKPAPAMVSWLPDMAMGNVTGQYQAGWSVTGNSDYVVYGGEFPRINGTAQQGLVRFARKPIAPAKQGPQFTNGSLAPTLTPTSTTALRISWPAGFDRDDYTLTYKVLRTGVTAPRYTGTANSNWWTLPALGFVDTGLTPGAQYSYRIVVNDASGNTVTGSTVSVTMPTTFAPASAYADSVRSAGATMYWPLNETSGLKATDRAAGPASPPNLGVTDGVNAAGVILGQPGAITGDTAASLGDNITSRIYANGIETAPDTFSSQVWIKTGTTSGGRILGFSDLQVGTSGHRDRQVYMDNAGKLVFGVRGQDASLRTVASARSYNDDAWHMVTTTMGPQGMALYVDGVRVGRRSDTTQGEAYLGAWRLGGDNLDGWPSQPSSRNFVGTVDEVAVYPTALGQEQILAQYEASGRTSVIPPAPSDKLGAAVYADQPDLFWRLGETSGTTATDSGRSLSEGTYRNGVTLGQSGAVAANTAAGFDGNNQFISSNGEVSNPTVYTEEAWFKTTTDRGGKIIGFGNNATGTSSGYDRHVYMQDDGKIVFGTYTGQLNVVTSPSAYNDGSWHHVVASQSGAGMKLYLDGVAVGTNPQTGAQDYSGFWKVGGDNTWGSSSAYFAGTIDEVAVYSYELSAARVSTHFTAGGGVPNQDPSAAFTSTVNQRLVSFDASASADRDGTVASYAWDFGDGTTGTGVKTSHAYAAAGTYTVKLSVVDNKGATATVSQPVTATVPAAPTDAYGAAVTQDGPRLYWRLDETAGNTAVDASKEMVDGTYYNGFTLGRAGALPAIGKAVAFDGDAGLLSSNESFDSPSTYSEEAWFKTGSIRGGKIIGFGDNKTGSSNNYDRHVYLQDDGHLVFGTYTGELNTITSPAAYNNDQWHHVVATQSGSGMKLYVDGAEVGTHPATGAQGYTGHWKVGGDQTWGSSSNYLDGTIDEVAVYLSELSANRVAAHYAAAAPVPNQAPTASFTSTRNNLAVSTDAAASADADGTVVTYGWDFGDGFATTGKTANHTYAQAGTYTITLTVTDDDGATAKKTGQVTVKAANVAPTARFTAGVTELKVDLDAAGSTDSDGTLADYAWDYGDGSTGSGATASHTYATPGDRVVTLTVTDNDGGTDTVTKTVTATPPPNSAPVAQFNSTTDNLVASFSADASTDADGTISSYAWEFGDTGVATGKTPTHTYAAAGDYSVKLTVTDDDGATSSVTRLVSVTRSNQSPAAAFTTATTDLKVDVDAAASKDPDGSIQSYAWTFGDGGKATGVSPSHTYAAAGDYTVTVVVTDNDGASSSLSKTVTVALKANSKPVAAFSSTTSKLTAAFNASGSTDPDGTIAGYSWAFGDGTSGTGATTSHVYAAAGSYPVVLTVTDNAGATGTISRTVTVTAPSTLAVDGFERTVTNGWGSAETGGAWTISNTSSTFNVLNGAGTMKMAAGSGPSAYLNGVSATDVDLSTTYRIDRPGTGGGFYTSLVGRRIGTSDYRVKVRVNANDTILYLARTVNGTETVLSSQTVTGMVVGANESLNVRLQVQGVGTSTLRAKVWKTGTTEPTAWRLTSTDTTAALQNPGAVGFYTYLSGSATNGPITVGIQDFRAEPLG